MSKPHTLSPLEQELLDALATLRHNVDVSTIRTSAKVLAGWEVVLEVADKALAHAKQLTQPVAQGEGKLVVQCPNCGSEQIEEVRKERAAYAIKEWALDGEEDLVVQDYVGEPDDRGECIDSVPESYRCIDCCADLQLAELQVSRGAL